MRLRDRFALADGLAFLNHGSFGATPKAILEERQRHQTELERNRCPR